MYEIIYKEYKGGKIMKNKKKNKKKNKEQIARKQKTDRLWRERNRDEINRKERERRKKNRKKIRKRVNEWRRKNIKYRLRVERRYRIKNRSKINLSMNLRRRLIKQQCLEYLGGAICAICGYKSQWVCQFEFHHFKEKKEFSICNKIASGGNFESIKKELNKCKILCRNCHSFITSKTWTEPNFPQNIKNKILALK